MRRDILRVIVVTVVVLATATIFYFLGRIDGAAEVRYSREYKLGKELCDVIDQVDKHMGKSIDDITSIHAQVETGF